jgi:mono/diheme cytochrome c family protein
MRINMKKTGMAVLLLGFVVSSYGVAAAAGNAEEGKAVFLKHCASCHGTDGLGKEAVAKMMKTTIPPLPSKQVQALSDDDLKKSITEGKGKMKPLKDASATDVTNLVAFIRSLAKN